MLVACVCLLMFTLLVTANHEIILPIYVPIYLHHNNIIILHTRTRT